MLVKHMIVSLKPHETVGVVDPTALGFIVPLGPFLVIHIATSILMNI
jgi:hypothetical protein